MVRYYVSKTLPTIDLKPDADEFGPFWFRMRTSGGPFGTWK
jgi:hypothetical protein